MDAERPNDPNRLIEFIAATVEAMRDQMVTKAELRAEIGAVHDRIGTMDDRIGTMADKIGTMADKIGTMDHKIDTIGHKIDQMDHKIDSISDRMATRDAVEAGFVAVRGDIERVALQLDQVDRKQSLRTAALESEVSRIRSVVYLVVKDQPDLVRLLGG